MKIALKYLWSLAIIPFLVFLKGDLSVDTYMHVNQLESISETREKVVEKFNPPQTVVLQVKITPVSQNKHFSAEGFLVNLYSETYDLISQSQVVNGNVSFQLKNPADTSQNLHVVVLKTADELNYNVQSKNKDLVIYEDHMND